MPEFGEGGNYIMRYYVYFSSPDGKKLQHATVSGKTETECWDNACRLYGKQNIYGWAKE